MRRLALALALALLLGSAALPAFADYQDNFDQYPVNTVSPWSPGDPWTFTPDSGLCWTGKTLAQPLNSANAQTPPIMYADAFLAGCAGVSHHSDLSFTENSTGMIGTFTFYATLDAAPGTPSTDTVELLMCGTQESLTVNGTATGNPFVLLSSLSTFGTWTKISASSPFTPGTTCSIDIRVSSVVADVGGYRVDFDTTYLTGGNAVMGNANTFLETLNSNTVAKNPWFNITQFSKSYSVANYTGTTNAYFTRNLTAPDFYQPLTNAKLVTLYVSGTYRSVSYYYYRSIIPTSTSHQILYLDDPSSVTVIQYVFTVADFSNNFGQGTVIKLYAAGNTGHSTLISSGYLDSNHQFSAGLQPGVYAAYLTSGSNTFTATVTLGTGSSTATITVPSITVNYGQNQQTAITCIGFWSSPTQITAEFNDQTTTTTSMKFQLYIRNSTGSYSIVSPAAYTPGPYGSITYNGADYANLPQSQGASYYLTCTFTDTFGTGIIYPSTSGAAVLGGQAGGQLAIPDALNFGAFLPGISGPSNQIGGLAIFTAVAAGFSEVFNPIGALIVGVFGVYLSSAGFFGATVIMVIVSLLGGIGVMLWMERRGR